MAKQKSSIKSLRRQWLESGTNDPIEFAYVVLKLEHLKKKDKLKDYLFKIKNDGSTQDFIEGYKAAIEDLENE